jgi:hypothetical protein
MSTRNPKDSGDEFPHRLSWIESISYTVAIGFVGALAAGWLDGMVPWK